MAINSTKLFYVFVVIVIIFLLYMRNRFTPQYANKIWKWVDDHMHAAKEKLFSSMPQMREHLNRDLKILEIGSGGGMNFRYYPEGTQVTCLDPDPDVKPFLEENLKQFQNMKITLTDYICGKAENMSQFADDSFDAVVCTLVLCAVDNPEDVVKEVKRVLRPKDGVFYFAEHVFAKIGDGTRVIQKVAEPIWPKLFYGCHLMRESGEVVREAGFRVCKITRFDLHIPSLIMSPMRSAVYGTASK